ncbi:hypothetical protein AMJ47_01370 [Parcubacteria bacterium DG_72]|nr:MAG: hypothetical protein AMJ47_01370 [Parcubacteria bacterium DG_72]
MVQEILKNIEQKVEEQLLRIDKEKEKAVLALEKKYEQMQKEQKEKNLAEFKQKIESEIQEFSQKKKLELEFAVLEQKNNIIDNLYNEAGKKIAGENLNKLINSLFPKDVEGRIKAGRKTAKILKQITDKEVDDLEEEGFLIIGENVDLDFRISEILKQAKQDQKPELIKLIFS